MRTAAAIVLAVLAACGGGASGVPDDLDAPPAGAARLRRDVYTLWWSGARIGDVEEELHRGGDGGVRLIRREHLQVRRGDALAATRLTLEIRADAALRAEEIRVDGWGDGASAAARATRDDAGGWRIVVEGEPPRTADGALIPAELVPLLVARDGEFRGGVLLPGRGFAAASLIVVADGDHHRAELAMPGGRLVSRLDLDRDGAVLRAAGADGIVLVRATAADVAAPFDPPEVVDATAIPVAGAPADGATRLGLAIAPVDRAPPPALPGQAISADGDRWTVVLDPALPGALEPGAAGPDRTDEIVELVRAVDLRLDEDLAVTAATVTAARQARRGDCTTHALLFAALAGDAGVDVRLVTGFRLDGDRLVRHRWAIAWTGAAWMAVDPTRGEAPLTSFLLGLAVHGARADQLALADEVAFAGTGGARAKVHRAD